MTDIHARHYLERFARLPDSLQTHVIARIDEGALVVSTVDLTAGHTACRLTPDEVLWEETPTRTELVDLALDAQTVICQLRVDTQQAVDADIENGAHLLVAISHTTGAREVYIHHKGVSFLLGKLDIPEPVRH